MPCPTSFTWRLCRDKHPQGPPGEWARSFADSPARRWSTHLPTPTSQTRRWQQNWRTLSAAEATPRCNGRRSATGLGPGVVGAGRTEAVFELHASGGLESWRRQLAAWFDGYNELAKWRTGIRPSGHPATGPEQPARGATRSQPYAPAGHETLNPSL